MRLYVTSGPDLRLFNLRTIITEEHRAQRTVIRFGNPNWKQREYTDDYYKISTGRLTQEILKNGCLATNTQKKLMDKDMGHDVFIHYHLINIEDLKVLLITLHLSQFNLLYLYTFNTLT